MHNSRIVCAVAISAMLLSGCSTRPRNFAASVSSPVPDRVAFENDYRRCKQLVAAGRSSGFRDAALTGVGGAGAGALFGAGSFAAASSWSAAGAAATAVPFVGVFASFGISRAIRGGKEKKFKRNMTACLSEYGYSVADWKKLPKKADAARYAADHSDQAVFVPAVESSDTTIGSEPVEDAKPR